MRVEQLDLAEPMAILAWRGLSTGSPEDAQENAELLDVFRMLAERYTNVASTGSSKDGDIDTSLQRILSKIRSVKDIKEYARGLDLPAPELASLKKLLALDTMLEEMAGRAAQCAMDNVKLSIQLRRGKQTDLGKLLPRLAELMRGRDALCQKIFNRYRSPAEVISLQGAMDAVGVSAVEKKTKNPSLQTVSAPEATRENRETREILNEILRDAPALVYASFLRENFPEGSPQHEQMRGTGYHEIKEPRFGTSGIGTWLNFGVADSLFGRDSSGALKAEPMLVQEGANEVVVLRPVTQGIFENQKRILKTRGFLGIVKQSEVTEQVRVGTRNLMHAERVDGGKQEPLVELMYRTYDEPRSDEYHGYQDYSGRVGQLFSVTFRLPESLARKCLQQMQSDPAFLRKMVEQAALSQNGILEAAWRQGEGNGRGHHPLRPPYEQWLAQHPDKGSKVYVHSELDSPNDSVFHPENLLPVK